MQISYRKANINFWGILPIIRKLLLAIFLSSSYALAAENPYIVECTEGGKCKVDKATYIGWRTYHAACHVCHAQDAVGSTFAPSLVERLKSMEKERFVVVLTDGFTGTIGVMPGWKKDPNVFPKVEMLWAFLKARSDGALGKGKPKKLP